MNTAAALSLELPQLSPVSDYSILRGRPTNGENLAPKARAAALCALSARRTYLQASLDALPLYYAP